MKRSNIIQTVGSEFLISNIENDEFKYSKEFKKLSIPFTTIKSSKGSRHYDNLDIRFVCNDISVLIETKVDFDNDIEMAKEQLSAYVEYEKQINNNKIVAILANTSNNKVMVWRGVVSDADYMPNETALKTMSEYVDFYTSKVNDKERVMANTYKLNEILHKYGINEKLK